MRLRSLSPRAIRRAATALGLAALLTSCSLLTAPFPATGGRRVLFVGNSLTYTGDLPRTIADLARSIGETPLVYKTVAYPNYALEDHYWDGIESIIAEHDWHLVVMQQGPSSLAANAEFLRTWTVKLDTAIRAAGARSALYMVWPSIEYPGSFPFVRQSYRNAALAVDGMFIPAGEAWIQAWEEDPELPLYGSDGFHPSSMGVYLTALVHFEMIYGRPATDLPKVAVVAGNELPLSGAKVLLLQKAAHEAATAWGIP